jgi:hypothetical protein
MEEQIFFLSPDDIIIDTELENYNPKRSDEEIELLRSLILNEGRVVEACCLWKTGTDEDPEYIMVDGFSRRRIVKDINASLTEDQTAWTLPCYIKDFKNKDEVKIFIRLNQSARRNLTPEQLSYFVGDLLESISKNDDHYRLFVQTVTHDRDLPTNNKVGLLSTLFKRSESTIKNDRNYYKGIQGIRTVNSDLADQILNREIPVKMEEVMACSALKPDRDEIKTLKDLRSWVKQKSNRKKLIPEVNTKASLQKAMADFLKRPTEEGLALIQELGSNYIKENPSIKEAA